MGSFFIVSTDSRKSLMGVWGRKRLIGAGHALHCGLMGNDCLERWTEWLTFDSPFNPYQALPSEGVRRQDGQPIAARSSKQVLALTPCAATT